MALTERDVKRIAELSRLELSEQEAGATLSQLNSVFALVEQLSQIDTTGVEPLAHVGDASLRLRPDAVTETNRREDYQKVAPATEAGLYLVPKVIE